MKEVTSPALPIQLTVVKLTTDPCTPVQYDGLKDDSNYKQSQSKEEEEAEEGESATQSFQHVQHNKKLAKKKANKAKAVVAIAHRAQNDFSGCIPDGFEVKVWEPLDVEWLNSYFCGVLGPCHYYLYLTNTVFVEADTNYAAAFKFSSSQTAKVPGMKVYHRPGMENTWQGITVNFTYRIHWQTLFGFALCRALCTNSTGKTTLVRRMALVIAHLGLYCEAIDTFNKVYDKPFVAQHGPQLTISQVYVPDNKRLKRFRLYGTPATIPQWDGWREVTKEDYYRLMFKHAEESTAGVFSKANSFYYYIGIDLNVSQLWKRTPVHSTMPSIGAATNIALTDCEMVDVTAAGGPMTSLITESKPLPAAANITTEESTKTMDAGGDQLGKKMG
ncbi:hypothetical protein C0992_009875 [Termitomyces sp. T32_za158]|nr:hypothetical protein C0992_009875 [Termitomyces sp. T32_za158]